MIILGIETSCDETALAIIETREKSNGGTGGENNILECRVINSLVHSQAELHSAYGGVYPSLAKREHGKNLVPLLHKLLSEYDADFLNDAAQSTDENKQKVLDSFKEELQKTNPDLWNSIGDARFLTSSSSPKIDRIAVTEGPGLEPTLWVGINFARILGGVWQVPIIPVNHMEGHIVGSLLKSDAPMGSWQKLTYPPLPAVAFLISGGHTELVLINDFHADAEKRYKILGQTKDDAVGEAFDKVARLLGLPYPGGPHISKLAHEAYEAKIPSPLKLPRPMISSGDLDFSFSGLKTSVLYAVQKNSTDGTLDENWKKGMAYEFEQAVAETLETKLRKALDQSAAGSLIIGGGVSANHVLRKRFETVAREYNIPLFLPSQHISGDNALMIALAGAIAKSGHLSARPLKAEGTKRLA